MKENNDYQVYFHYDENNILAYVGMGRESRGRAFATNKRSSDWINYFQNHDIRIVIHEENLTEKEALTIEGDLIKAYKKEGLCHLNSINGVGFGGNTYAKLSEEEMDSVKEKISNKLKINNGNKGQYIGEKNPMYGRRSPVRKKYKIQNKSSQEIIVIDSRVALEKYLFDYRYNKYNDKEKRRNIIHDISKINICEFSMGRRTEIDDWVLIEITRECDIQSKV